MARRRLVSATPVILVLIVVAASTVGSGFAGDEGDADLALRPIAEQELSLSDVPLVWQVSELPVLPDEDHPIPFYTGFLYAHTAPLVVFRDGGRRFVRLTADDALPVADGELFAPTTLREDNATFLALELVAEDDAYDPTGEPFEPAAGDYVLELLRAELEGAQGEQDVAMWFDDSDLPVLLVLVVGELEVTVGDREPEDLKSGDVLTVEAGVALRRLGDGPVVVLAVTLRSAEDDDEDRAASGDEAAVRATAGAATGADAGRGGSGGGTGSAGGGGTADPIPTPTPKPTEAPNEMPEEQAPAPPPAGGNNGSGGAGSGSGSGSGSGGVGVELGPGDGPCTFCSPADDGLFEEEDFSSDPCLFADGGGDSDSDGLNDCGEATAGTDPNNPDTDGDDVRDGDEVLTYGTDPLNADTDGDGLSDGLEVLWLTTDPRNADMDGDGLSDGDEYRLGTYLRVPDTDGDGLWDGEEVFIYATDPLNPDTDGDCIWDGEEVRFGTSPIRADTDGDGLSDSREAFATDPNDPEDHDVLRDGSICSPLPPF